MSETTLDSKDEPGIHEARQCLDLLLAGQEHQDVAWRLVHMDLRGTKRATAVTLLGLRCLHHDKQLWRSLAHHMSCGGLKRLQSRVVSTSSPAGRLAGWCPCAVLWAGHVAIFVQGIRNDHRAMEQANLQDGLQRGVHVAVFWAGRVEYVHWVLPPLHYGQYARLLVHACLHLARPLRTGSDRPTVQMGREQPTDQRQRTDPRRSSMVWPPRQLWKLWTLVQFEICDAGAGSGVLRHERGNEHSS